MFWKIAAHEVSFRLRKLSTHAYFALFLALSYLLINGAGGAFGDNVVIGGTSAQTNVNSPYVLGITIAVLTLFGTIITAAFMGQTVYRDYDSGIHPLIFTTPVRKVDYLGGRFVGALAVNLYIFSSFGLGLLLGEVTPWLDAERFGAFRLSAYLQPYLAFVIPNLLFTGALFFAMAATLRKMLPNYIGGALLFMGYNLASLLFSADAIQNSTVAPLLDPFGLITLQRVTRYWTVAEQNAQLLPLTGLLGLNRLLWIGVGVALVGALAARFRFAHVAQGGAGGDEATGGALARLRPSAFIGRVDLPAAQTAFDLGARLRQYLALTRRYFLEIVRDVYFYAIVAAGILFLLVGGQQIGQVAGTPVRPVTRLVAGDLMSQFFLFVIILIAFYAGRLVWRERDLKVQPITDALPVRGGTALLAKGTALVAMVGLLLAVVMASGIAVQLSMGFAELEVGVYLKMLFVVEWASLAAFCVLTLAIHVIVNHKYAGHFLVILYFVGLPFLGQLGLEHRLWRFGSGLSMPYSDMNGYGHFPWRFSWFALHWGGVAVLLALAARLARVRGLGASLAARWKAARRRLTPRLGAAAGAAGALVLATGTFIVYNTHALNSFQTSDAAKAERAAYERTYDRFEDRPQPRVAAVDVTADLYPERREAHMQGTYTLVNRSGRAIDSLLVAAGGGDTDVETLALDRAAETVRVDTTHRHRLYAFDAPLAPGDTVRLRFEQATVPQGFPNGGGNTNLVDNGIFLNNGFLPAIGYQAGRELSRPSDRRDHGLPEKPRMAPPTDSSALRTPYISSDADWMDFRATVTTSAGQRALAPGRLVRTDERGDRRAFVYEAQAPTLNFYTFLSARYATATDTWTSADGDTVDIAVYHHPRHDYNVDRMIEAAKASLDYYTEHFGPYQNDHLRIAEFPQYQGSFAQSFLGTIPFSEEMGFIMRLDEEENVDFPFYVTAHEVAHQWWGHQVAGGNVKGATMLSETLCQYSALMVAKQEYGPGAMRNFLEYELDRYLVGRSQEQRRENVLTRVAASQGYIHYRKGSLAMYALQDYVGEARVNRALRRFVDRYRFAGPPYPHAEPLMREFERVTPDSLRYLLEDTFREITLYQNRATGATYTETADGRYRVDIAVDTRKVQTDSLGSEREAAMNDWIDVGVFAEGADVGAPGQETLYLEKHRFEGGADTVSVVVDEKPARAGIDPYLKLVDRTTSDNVTDATPKE
jgi:hypothetical protein